MNILPKTMLSKYLILCFTIALSVSCGGSHQSNPDPRPNILLIVADDMAYSDLGCFGSEIRTPHIDRLASEGILFTQFHAGPQCAPSRAMLISGSDNHMAGVGRQDVPPESKWYGKRGYERNLTDRIIPFTEILQEAGYFTCLSGKWHLGYDSLSWPHLKGFDKSFGMLNGGTSQYSGMGLGVEFVDTLAEWIEDGRRTNYPDGTYSTEFHTDNLLSYIKLNREQNKKPFFAFASYTSPHWPLQLPEEWRDKYAGVYDSGYERLKEDRLKALKNKQFVDEDVELPPYGTPVTPWSQLTDEEKKIESRKMELYASMVENLDHHIGRLRSTLQELGEWENTLVIFFSDNGAAHRDFYANPERGGYLRSKYNNDYENMGSPSSFVSYGHAWAQSCMVPYKFHKTYATEGGLIAPAIISGHSVKQENVVNRNYVNIMDIAPTILQAAGINADSIFAARNKPMMRGKSLYPILMGQQSELHGPEETFAMEFNGSIYIQQGEWKLVNYKRPFKSNAFELFNLKRDPGELYDLKEEYQDRYNDMLALWNEYMEENEILLQNPEEEKKFNY